MSATRTAALLLTFAVLWLLWSGVYVPVTLVFGAVACVLTAWLALRMRSVDDEAFPFGTVPRLLLYLPWLMWQVVLSNIAVVRIILSPRLPIAPRMYKVRPLSRSTIGQVIYANSITLTPGTISLDLRDGEILVHALVGDDDEPAEDEMNRRVRRLEGDSA